MAGGVGGSSTVPSQSSSTELQVSVVPGPSGTRQVSQLQAAEHSCPPLQEFVGTVTVHACTAPTGQGKPSSVSESQSLSRPSHRSVSGMPGLHHSRPTMHNAVRMHAPTPQTAGT